jgi:hypothetical protein
MCLASNEAVFAWMNFIHLYGQWDFHGNASKLVAIIDVGRPMSSGMLHGIKSMKTPLINCDNICFFF